MTTGAPNIRLQLGMFTVYPAVGSVPAGGAVQVTVDMIAENPGFCEEVGASNRGTALFFRKNEKFEKSVKLFFLETMVNLLERKICNKIGILFVDLSV